MLVLPIAAFFAGPKTDGGSAALDTDARSARQLAASATVIMFAKSTVAVVRAASRQRTAVNNAGKRFMEIDNSPGKVRLFFFFSFFSLPPCQCYVRATH